MIFAKYYISLIYYLLRLSGTWHTAENHCRTFGGHLISIGDEGNLRALQSVFNHSIGSPLYWSGLIYVNSSTSWSFSDGTPINYVISKFGDLNSRLSPAEKCVLFAKGKLQPIPRIRDCTAHHHFVCRSNGSTCAAYSYGGKSIYVWS
jgi:hypothetical protein